MSARSPYPDLEIPSLTLPQLVLRHAPRLADKPALIDGPSGRSLTYRQLADGVRRVAAGLAHRGFRQGDVLAIFSPNLPEYAIALYGALAAGGTVTTVNTLATAGELATQLADSGATYLITMPQLMQRVHSAAERVHLREIFVFGEAEGATSFAKLLQEDLEPPDISIDVHDDIACLPYSSGTTGLPKGVMLSHFNLVANVLQVQSAVSWSEDDIFVAVLPFFHIYGLNVILSAWLARGATLVTMPRFDLEQFLAIVQQYHVSVAMVVPPILLQLARHPIVDTFDLSSLHSITVGAAPISAEVLRATTARIGCKIMQGYGLTEVSGVAHITTDDLEEVATGTIGWPVANTECKVVDIITGAELEPGQQGEICLRGPQVMRGYLNRQDATRAMIDTDGWLHSGDIGCLDAHGRCFVVDRIKELIKYNAYQVAPAELEAVLISHPAVAEAAVVGMPDQAAGEIPKAYVVARSEIAAEALMAYVAERVAPYKKVRAVEFVDEIPKSASGKLLRRVLIERERDRVNKAAIEQSTRKEEVRV